MKKSTFLGSTVSVLLLFSVISYSRSIIQQQKPAPQAAQSPTQSANDGTTLSESNPTTASIAPTTSTERPREVAPAAATSEKVVLSETYTATAYSLRGRTASGATVAQGMIAADP